MYWKFSVFDMENRDSPIALEKQELEESCINNTMS